MCSDSKTSDVFSHQTEFVCEAKNLHDEICSGKLREAPLIPLAEEAVKDLLALLRGESRGKGGGYKDPNIDHFTRHRLDGMKTLLKFYTDKRSKTYGHWSASSLMAAVSLNRGTYCARILRSLTRQYINDRTVLPINPYGNWNETLLVDESLCTELNLYLQEIGNHITAEKLVLYLHRKDVMERHGITRKISAHTARRYLKILGFRFREPSKGSYADGHERGDVVDYREKHYLPSWAGIMQRVLKWTSEGIPEYGPLPGRQVIVWFHDETIFYAHDRRRRNWYHKDAPCKPYQKGDGHSLMIADFVSAEFGFLRTPDGRTARRLFRPGKNRDGYFTSEDIKDQARAAMDLVEELYPEYEHVFIYDNATTHLKREDGALSARKMTKGPSANFFTSVQARDDQGKPIPGQRTKIQMKPGKLPDGTEQPLYYPDDFKDEKGQPSELAGKFKGIVNILLERNINIEGKKFECRGFKCASPAVDCCMKRILYNQPDFSNQESILEATYRERGFQVIFLPKYHCELNPIEQCWGYSKRLYRFYPQSSREDVLQKNAVECLDAIPIESIRRFFNHAYKFADAYSKGLNGRQAAWAARKYRGHRVLPESLMEDMGKAGIV
ncbi:hypothetical protein K435DRAFT_661731 [Dendrothele bispora CBS 962.96]|uniref:Tc1-like transposase DDE domain-containing protein n=1 Tax=Dendrothele bispora (strain CBS 962.96) TaxID=1314807 RepID=A0A4S8M7K5_DENBC|nr:hypothetical protein K435DRAFT_661731 [Dendrothele bispora CBS 962.96]